MLPHLKLQLRTNCEENIDIITAEDFYDHVGKQFRPNTSSKVFFLSMQPKEDEIFSLILALLWSPPTS